MVAGLDMKCHWSGQSSKVCPCAACCIRRVMESNEQKEKTDDCDCPLKGYVLGTEIKAHSFVCQLKSSDEFKKLKERIKKLEKCYEYHNSDIKVLTAASWSQHERIEELEDEIDSKEEQKLWNCALCIRGVKANKELITATGGYFYFEDKEFPFCPNCGGKNE